MQRPTEKAKMMADVWCSMPLSTIFHLHFGGHTHFGFFCWSLHSCPSNYSACLPLSLISSNIPLLCSVLPVAVFHYIVLIAGMFDDIKERGKQAE
jgi:hypothetical protein